MAYLAQWRLKLGAEILQSTEDSVAKVAAEVGYGSEAALIVRRRNSVATVMPRRPSASNAPLTLSDVCTSSHGKIYGIDLNTYAYLVWRTPHAACGPHIVAAERGLCSRDRGSGARDRNERRDVFAGRRGPAAAIAVSGAGFDSSDLEDGPGRRRADGRTCLPGAARSTGEHQGL